MNKNANIVDDLKNLLIRLNWIIDSFGIRLEEFLREKSLKNYDFYVRLRSIIIFSILAGFILTLFIDTLFMISIPILLLIYRYLGRLILKKFNYNKYFYNRDRKKILNYKNQLILIKQHYIIRKLLESEVLLKNLINGIKKKIDSISTIFKTHIETIQKYSLMSIISVLLVPIIDYIIDTIKTPYQFDYFIILFSLLTIIYVFREYYDFRYKRKIVYMEKAISLTFLEDKINVSFILINSKLQQLQLNSFRLIRKKIRSEEYKISLDNLSKFERRNFIKKWIKTALVKIFKGFEKSFEYIGENDINSIIKKTSKQSTKLFMNSYERSNDFFKTQNYHLKFAKRVCLWEILQKESKLRLKELNIESISVEDLKKLLNNTVKKITKIWKG